MLASANHARQSARLIPLPNCSRCSCSAAIADTKAVAKLSTAELRTLFARIGGVEAMHWALLRSALGEPPIPDSLLPES